MEVKSSLNWLLALTMEKWSNGHVFQKPAELDGKPAEDGGGGGSGGGE